MSRKTDNTVSKYYAECRHVTATWIWDDKNTPKFGGFGKIVEMDESFFVDAPKYNRGRHRGTTSGDDEQWVF